MSKADESFRNVKLRSHDRCEAMVMPNHAHVWMRCFSRPIEVHHMLTRSRGGKLLDAVGETMHLIALCPKHHRVAHAPGGHEVGLMIDGYVTRGPDGRPVYQGSHDGLRDKYGAMDLSMVPEDAPSDQPREDL